MNTKLISMLGAAVFGSLGGWMGARMGMMTGYFAGMLGTAFGFYLARRFVRAYLE